MNLLRYSICGLHLAILLMNDAYAQSQLKCTCWLTTDRTHQQVAELCLNFAALASSGEIPIDFRFLTAAETPGVEFGGLLGFVVTRYSDPAHPRSYLLQMQLSHSDYFDEFPPGFDISSIVNVPFPTQQVRTQLQPLQHGVIAISMLCSRPRRQGCSVPK